MAVLNLRGIPDELARLVKATAASEGKTIPQFVADVLEQNVRRGGWTAAKTEDKDGGAVGAEAGNNKGVDERGVGGGITESDTSKVRARGVRAVAGGGGGK